MRSGERPAAVCAAPWRADECACWADPSSASEARVVVMGGGIIGTSVAYHLAHSGVKDVVLLERDHRFQSC